MRNFYDPKPNDLEKLSSGSWCAAYSGGKDSTSLVTWVEWLRRSGWITADNPMLVRSDTGVEDPALIALAEGMTRLLEDCGWHCYTVRPEVHERLYPQILGRGLPPVHPGVRHLRWCTRSTKIDPMGREKDRFGIGLTLTGLRLGESAMRDGKLLKSSCAAGGECGIPDPGEGRYSPLLQWKTCQVIDWLNGHVGSKVRDVMENVFALTRQLVDLYGIRTATNLFEETEVLSQARFGCVGCPAIGKESHAPASVMRRNGAGSPLNELYDVWFEARKAENRLIGWRKGKAIKGPIRMEARKRLFDRVIGIQERSGVTLVTPEDEAFIRGCWERNVYPRGWSESDEVYEWPEGPLLGDGNQGGR